MASDGQIVSIGGYTVVVFPYVIGPTGSVVLDAPFAFAGEKRIFAR